MNLIVGDKISIGSQKDALPPTLKTALGSTLLRINKLVLLTLLYPYPTIAIKKLLWSPKLYNLVSFNSNNVHEKVLIQMPTKLSQLEKIQTGAIFDLISKLNFS